ncbi:MAG: hypothetical protein M3136_01180 [Thermoproteota archaeon]|nr:hypothetical protein [Thermoproteota archaeon]
MHLTNKKDNSYVIAASVAVALFTFAIMATAASNMATTTTPAAATTTAATPNNTTTTPSGIELSPEPVYQEQIRDEGMIPINQTHIQLSFSGNGTLSLPNGTEPIRITSTGSGIASMIGTFAGKEILTTEDGSENATATFYEIVRFGEQEGRGIAIAVFHTNSTDMLAPLDGMIMIGVDELPQEGNSTVTLWEWQSGIPLPTSTTESMEEPPIMNTTTMITTNATTTTAGDDINATGAVPEEEVVEEEEEQQQQATPTAPSPLFE